MKISEAWLREWVSPPISTDELAEQLTMAGLEVDGVEAVAGEFSGVVVGEIVAVEPHPDADKLRVCQVSYGSGDPLQVVCGAPNAREGIKVPFATVGAQLPGAGPGKESKIKKAKLRGVESNGMLCSAVELKAGDDDSGLWELPADAPVGAALQDYLKLADSIIEVDLTPNRGDCQSMRGIAREVGVLSRIPVTSPEIKAVSASIKDELAVRVEAREACPRYLGRVLRNVDVSKPSPLWLQERLRRAGVRAHDCVVDVTNYVLLELGQPLHAFDLEKVKGEIVVRQSKAGEKIVLLDGNTVELKANTLLITDDSGPIAMAGIMGGQSTAVSETSSHIFLESAFFSPLAIAGRARSYGMHTDASHRFERGVDSELQSLAIERATELLLEIAGGEAGPVVSCVAEDKLPKVSQVNLRRERITKGLGFAIDDAEVLDILSRLGLEKTVDNADGWSFKVPSYRFDIAIEEDLLEELARVYGYNRLPSRTAGFDWRMDPSSESRLPQARLKDALVSLGYREAITYSFIGEELARQICPDYEPIAVRNPISADLAVMRPSLWPGLLQTLQSNLNRQQNRARLFEAGMRFRRDDGAPHGIRQEPVIAGLIYGSRFPENWTAGRDTVDFFDLKGDLESLIGLSGAKGDFTFSAGSDSALHPGQCAVILRNGGSVGLVGALHPAVQQQLEIDQPVYLFEIEQGALTDAVVPKFEELSRFPEVRRDLAIVVDTNTPVEALVGKVRTVAGAYLSDLKVFDVYSGKGIDPLRKSVALGLTYQHPSRTLTESEINASIDAVISGLKEDFDANLR